MSKHQTPEEKDADTKRFVVKGLTLGLVGVLLLFAYSVVFTEQPLFNEAPTDKAIFAVLTLLAGQSLQILANYISRSAMPSQPFNPCAPTTTSPFAPKPMMPTMTSMTPSSPSPFGNPNQRPPL